MSIQPKKENTVASFAPNYTPEQLELVKNTVCKGATDDELKLFLYTCARCGLDPMLKQIYAIKRKSGQSFTMTIQTSIDGLRAIADRTGCYAPGQPSVFSYAPNGSILCATAFVKKKTADGTWHEVSSTAYFEEYAQSYNGEYSKFWKTMPHVMISKCAEAQALRRAFPVEMGGIYTHEEMANSLNKSKIEEEIIDGDALRNEEESKEDEIVLPLPEGIFPDDVDRYIEILCVQYKTTMPRIKKKALENPDGFWEKFRAWKEKN